MVLISLIIGDTEHFLFIYLLGASSEKCLVFLLYI